MPATPASARPTPPPTQGARRGTVSTIGAIAIGVGGMMGAAIYTLLGLAGSIAGPWVPVSFIIGGLVSAFSVYSYAKLGAAFPSRGGAGEFLVRGFGNTMLAGGLNVFQFLGWIIAMALYGVGFGGYAASLIPGAPSWAGKAFGVGLVVLVLLINLIGSKLVSKSEMVVIAIELVILAVFVVFAASHIDPGVFATSADAPGGAGADILGMFFAAGLLYVAYEGFGVVTNSAGDMANPKKQLPRAMYTALVIVIAVYVLISAFVVMLMSKAEMTENQGHVLAEAARAAMGEWGFIILAIAALLATASAVNATMYGDANLSFMMATKGEIPEDFTRGVWHGGKVGLFVVAGITMLFIAVFPLAAVGQMASLAFLLIYASVSVGHLRVRAQTGAKATLLVLAIVLNIGLFALLLGYTIAQGQVGTWVTLLGVVIVSFVAEWIIRRTTGRELKVAQIPGVPDTTTATLARGTAPAAAPTTTPRRRRR